MPTRPAPSAYILRKAWELGQKMARKERRLLPDLTGAAEFPTYPLFRQSHRYHLEQRPAFLPWDEKLQALIEREAHGRGLAVDNPRIWDAFYTHIGGPIRNVFWSAWEDAHQLELSYKELVNQAEQARRGPAIPLHVYRGDRPLADVTDPEVWEGILEELARDAELHANTDPPNKTGLA